MKKVLLTFLCFLASFGAFAQVVINELESDAGNFEGGGEWIEFKNIGATPQDMSCWRLTNGGNVQITFPQGLILGAGQYLLVGDASQMMCPTCDYKSLNTLFTLSPDGFGYGTGNYAATIFLNTDIVANGGCGCLVGTGGFNNGSLSGDRVVLMNDAGAIMDAIMYSDGNNYGTGALTVNFAGTATCPPLAGATIPAVGDVVYNGRVICNDLSSCNSSYARLPDGNNAATVTWSQAGNLACTGCTDPCGAATSTASADYPTPGIDNTVQPWTATINAVPVATTITNMTVCGATPITFEYQINNYTNVALTATQTTGNLGSYVKTNNASPVNFTIASFNATTGITTLSATVTPPLGTTNYEFVWGDANTNCATCPGSTSALTPNNVTSTAKECYVYHKLTVLREEPLAGSPTASCSLPGSVILNGATGTNLEYTLQIQTTTAGPFTTIAGPQSGNSFAGIIDNDADPTLPNYQVLVSTTNTTCINPTPIVVPIPNACLGNPACAQYVTSGPGMPTFLPAGGSVVCAGSSVQFNVDINGVCTNGQVELKYDYNNTFDPYTQGNSLGIATTTVGATPPTTTAAGKVFINEFAPRPQLGTCAGTPNGSNPNSGEWIELYNAGPGVVDLGGWILSDGDWTATIPAGVKLAPNGYYLIGGGGTFCSVGVLPDLNIETCNCASVSPVSSDIMNLTDGGEQVTLFDCSGNFIDGVLWGGGQGLPDVTANDAPATGCGNYITAKSVNIPAAASMTNSGGSLSGGTNVGRYRTSANTWTTTTTALNNYTPKAANIGGDWDGSSLSFGTQCPPPPVSTTITVNLPDTCSQAGPTLITLKAIYKPDPVAPCSASDVTATATFVIPSCDVLTLSGNGDYCVPATAPLTITSSATLVGNFDINLSNGVNTTSINSVTGSGPFSTTVSDGGVWTISSITPPLGVCPPKKSGSATVNVLPIPAITNAPLNASFCYLYGYDLSILESQITSAPSANSFVWYDQAIGGSPISTYVNPSTSTTYYVAPTTGNPANCEGTRVPVVLNVNDLPTAPNVSCNGITATLTPQSPNCMPTACAGVEYSADGINWSSNTTYTAADLGWAGWGSALNSTIYIRNSNAVNCYNYVTYLSPCSAPLPTELLNFTGRLVNNELAELKWETANEKNVSHFEIERSYDKMNFKKIGQTDAKGNSNLNTSYLFNDEHIMEGANYYRLKAVDEDGKYTYSNTILIQAELTNSSVLAIYPNPSFGILNIDISMLKQEKAMLQIIDMTGRAVVSKPIELSKGFSSHTLSTESLANGQYMIRIALNNEVFVRKFTKE